MALRKVSLDDKYKANAGQIFLTGTQALVRLPILQRQRDLAAGHNTAGFLSGYRGSPLGGIDQALWRASGFLKQHHLHFNPGVNEDLAATSIWGSQQVPLFPDAQYDGVFAYWYGKGPGVDRSMDVFKHGNMSGTSPLGGVLVLTGDDHACKSSTLPHQSEPMMAGAMIPVLHPSGVQDILDYGLYGWAMSRFAGVWVSLKIIADTADAAAVVDGEVDRIKVVHPDLPFDRSILSIRKVDDFLEQEARLHGPKMQAVQAFHRAHGLDRVLTARQSARFGIMTTGKAHGDVMQALHDLGISEERADALGIRIYKVAMTWPLEPEGALAFARGLDEILVVEEKRAFMETQLKSLLFDRRPDPMPLVVGKQDEHGQELVPSTGELAAGRLARMIASCLSRFHQDPAMEDRLGYLEALDRQLSGNQSPMVRTPYFCSGCPHNSSTKVPEGSQALAGIGCHFMALYMDRDTSTFTQMGGEGASWIGRAPFTSTNHMFANIGDGTYVHSGILAIRASVAAKVNVTYKILYNDAVAMTGGQSPEGTPSVARLSRQVAAEGAKAVRVVSEEPSRHRDTELAHGTTVHHRDDLMAVQRELRGIEGVTVLIYDQVCATEKRRRRKRGQMHDPDERIVINHRVCEGCGDCSVASNCLSVEPVETELGRKRKINQSSCNKDFSCVKGFCPSFVSVVGGKLKKGKATTGLTAAETDFPDLPEPAAHTLETPFSILAAGVGGTGIVTLGQIIAMAAHLDGRGVTTLDQTGLAQKYGAVTSHIRIARAPEMLHSSRIASGNADMLLGCDMITSGMPDSLKVLSRDHSHAFINEHAQPTADFVRDPDHKMQTDQVKLAIERAVGQDHAAFFDATALSLAVCGDAIGANMVLLGYAWQNGQVPVSENALIEAIRLNGVALELNRTAFLWGRRAAAFPDNVRAMLDQQNRVETRATWTLDQLIDRRADFLTAYQDRAYADSYRTFVAKVREQDQAIAPGQEGALSFAVAEGLFKLMAIKDEYEVARLYTDGVFRKELEEMFEPGFELEFHLAPPMFSSIDKNTGLPKKQRYASWMMTAFRFLAAKKHWRGTWKDVFGRSEERRMERALIPDYREMIDGLMQELSPSNYRHGLELARSVMGIRGYGHVKEKNLAEVRQAQAGHWKALRGEMESNSQTAA